MRPPTRLIRTEQSGQNWRLTLAKYQIEIPLQCISEAADEPRAALSGISGTVADVFLSESGYLATLMRSCGTLLSHISYIL